MKCPLCPKEYQSEKDLEKHLEKIHNTDLITVERLKEKPMIKIKFSAEDVEYE